MRFINNFFHVDVVDMSLLEGVGLCSSSIILLLGAIRSIVPLLIALEAEHLGDIPPGFSIWTRVSIVVVVDGMSIPLVPRVISTEPTIVVVAVGSVAASSMVTASTMMMVPSVMAASTVITMVVVGGVLLE